MSVTAGLYTMTSYATLSLRNENMTKSKGLKWLVVIDCSKLNQFHTDIMYGLNGKKAVGLELRSAVEELVECINATTSNTLMIGKAEAVYSQNQEQRPGIKLPPLAVEIQVNMHKSSPGEIVRIIMSLFKLNNIPMSTTLIH